MFVYLVTQPVVDDFRGFLQRHTALLCALRVWTVRIVVPPHLPSMAERAERVAQQELCSPLRSATVEELRWYFDQCRALPADATHGLEPRFDRDRSAFQSARYQSLFRAWKQDGDTVLVEASPSALVEAVNVGVGRIETRMLLHAYGHLSRLAGVA